MQNCEITNTVLLMKCHKKQRFRSAIFDFVFATNLCVICLKYILRNSSVERLFFGKKHLYLSLHKFHHYKQCGG